MDIVISWVDSKSPDWRIKYEKHKSEASFFGQNEARFRNNGELRYLLRSIEKNITFVEDIYLVTSGEAPDFIDFSHPKIHLIKHQDIAPPNCLLPTFSSSAIETFIHKIPGLSSDFLYFNDDIIVLRPVSKDFFIDECAYWINQDMPELNSIHSPKTDWEHKLFKTRSFIKKYVAHEVLLLTSPHAPKLVRKCIYEKVLELIATEVNKTRSKRFRSDLDSVHFMTFYESVILNTNILKDEVGLAIRARRFDQENLMSLPLRDSVDEFNARKLQIEEISPQFICIQDEMPSDIQSDDPIVVAFNKYMCSIFPTKFSFEK
jgi:hypothetical protein